ncbi:T9SS type A sorting domain-containing protein [Bacteroidota bacterium]
MKTYFFQFAFIFSALTTFPCKGQDNWTSLSAPYWFSTFIIHPGDSNILYATQNDGIYKSINGGEGWTNVDFLGYDDVTSIVLNPLYPDTLYVGVEAIGTGGTGIYRSSNRGNAWTQVLSAVSVRCLAIDDSEPHIVYAGTVTNSMTGDAEGIYKSHNGGETWIPRNGELTNLEINYLSLNPGNPEVLYAGTSTGIFKSNNGGSSWFGASTGLPGGSIILSLAVNMHDTSMVIAGTNGDGLYRSTNGGSDWNAANTGLGGLQVNFVAFHPTVAGIVYAGLDAGLYRSYNNGNSWEKVDENGIMFGGDVGTIRFNPQNPEWVYALFSIQSTGAKIFKRRFPVPCEAPITGLSGTSPLCFGGSEGSVELTVSGGTSPYSFSWSTGDTSRNLSGLQSGKYFVVVTDSLNCSQYDSIRITQPEELVTEVTNVTNVSDSGMADGNAAVTVTGGTPPYSYLWNDESATTDSSVFNLPANKWFRMTATDYHGCISEDSVMLSEPRTLSAEISSYSDVTCWGEHDGSATVSILGGDESYAILWDDPAGSTTKTVFNLGSGRWYRVSVTDGSLKTVPDSIYISEPEQIILSKDYSSVLCEGADSGYIDISVSGGVLPYQYEWSEGSHSEDLDNIAAGTYLVHITDQNGCSKYDTSVIDSISPYEGLEICMVTVIRGMNLIVWERPDVKGIDFFKIYRQTVEFGYVEIGRVDFDSLSIFYDESSVPEEISHFYKISAVDICGNESALSDHHKTMHLTANVGTADEVNLIWENYEGFVFSGYSLTRGSTADQMEKIRTLPNSVTSFTDNNHPDGTLYYQTSIERPEPCYPSAAKKSGTGPYQHTLSNLDNNKLKTTLKEHEEQNELILFPNPAARKVHIRFNNPGSLIFNLTLLDLTGRVVQQLGVLNGSLAVLDLEEIPAGIYLIRIAGHRTYFRKIIVL